MQNSSSEYRNYDLWVRLRQTAHAIHKAREKELRQSGISIMESAALFIVQAIGRKATLVEISRLLFREPNSVSELVRRMEKNGLVRKVKDLDKRNMIRVVLTEKGEQAYSQASKRASIHRIMSVLSEADRQQFDSYLIKLSKKAITELGRSSIPPIPTDYMSTHV